MYRHKMFLQCNTTKTHQVISRLNPGSSGLDSYMFPVVEIKENRYAGWQQIKENKLVRTSLFCGYKLLNNGTALGEMPASDAFEGQAPITCYVGKYFVNSRFKNPGTTIGELLSGSFVIKGDRIDFLIGGGDFGELTRITSYHTRF